MEMKKKLLNRLDEIGAILNQQEGALALLALGSVGIETHRMDEFSDLDFFVLCKQGFKDDFIENTEWLNQVYEVSFLHRNTKDGYKLLFKDGIFCECAIFEIEEMSDILYSEGRVVWHAQDFSLTSLAKENIRKFEPMDIEFTVCETLTNLYVGLCRYHRGEILSAHHFISNYALNRILQLISIIEPATTVTQDKFSNLRRFEFRYPQYKTLLIDMVRGYDEIPQAAYHMLMFLDKAFEINQDMKDKILDLCYKMKK